MTPSAGRRIAKALFHNLGGISVVRWQNRDALRILMYHRFWPPGSGLRSSLEDQCRLLSRQYRPLSLSAAAAALRAEAPLAPNSIAVTVDDGHRDFFDHAFPLFQAYRIPAMVYLATDFITHRAWLWFDRLAYCVRHARAAQLEWEGKMWPLATTEERDLAGSAICSQLEGLPHRQRLASLQAIEKLTHSEVPAEPPEEYAPLDWTQIRAMRRQGIEFGAHTITHPILSTLESDAALTQEIQGSRDVIEEALQEPVLHFCYPSGRPQDRSSKVVDVVRQCGFRTAVTTERGLNRPGDDPFLLHRLGVEPGSEPAYFRQQAAGLVV
jgi:peptidoglycan/xylan/chitin deacetylase (PgdA/CDA1 family)